MSTLKKWNPLRESALGWPNLGRSSPFRELVQMQRQLDRLFDRSWRQGNGCRESLSVSEWAPSVDVSEDDKEYLIKAELPEVKKEDVKVNVEDGTLTLSGERKLEKEEKNKKYHRIERAYGSFERSFTLPDDADGAKVSAECKDGILKVHLPKNPAAKPKSVKVNVS